MRQRRRAVGQQRDGLAGDALGLGEAGCPAAAHAPAPAGSAAFSGARLHGLGAARDGGLHVAGLQRLVHRVAGRLRRRARQARRARAPAPRRRPAPARRGSAPARPGLSCPFAAQRLRQQQPVVAPVRRQLHGALRRCDGRARSPPVVGLVAGVGGRVGRLRTAGAAGGARRRSLSAPTPRGRKAPARRRAPAPFVVVVSWSLQVSPRWVERTACRRIPSVVVPAGWRRARRSCAAPAPPARASRARSRRARPGSRRCGRAGRACIPAWRASNCSRRSRPRSISMSPSSGPVGTAAALPSAWRRAAGAGPPPARLRGRCAAPAPVRCAA